jgi:acetylornithine deacetylase/succinyl-diaminopimelate desuccinylase-like protein
MGMVFSSTIVLEPTTLLKYNAQCGVVEFGIQTTGIAGHSSKSLPGANQKMVTFLADLYSQGWNRTNAGLIQGGVAANVVSDSCTATICIRPVSQTEYKTIKTHLDQCHSPAQAITMLLDLPPVESPGGSVVVQLAPFGTEAPFFPRPIIFGVGSIDRAHTDDEQIDIAELESFYPLLEQEYMSK